jgi:hypothetical protein
MLRLQRLLDLILMGNLHGQVDSFRISGAGETPADGRLPATHLNEIHLVFLYKNLILNGVTSDT